MKNQLRLSGGRKIQSPLGIGTRPTTSRVREAVMNLINIKIQNCDWLDLCSGSGAMGCEALQRGARRVLAIEKDKQTAKICKSNLMSIGNDMNQKNFVEVICHEVIGVLKKGCQKPNNKLYQDPRFDLVYLDPPYGSRIYSTVLSNLLEGNWLKSDSLVICEHSSSIGLKAPSKWIERDRRIYGNSALLILSPP